MALIKEDGSLDIERYGNLPFEDYIVEMGKLTQEQKKEYYANLQIREHQDPVRVVKVDYTLEEALGKGIIVDADKLLNDIRNKKTMIYIIHLVSFCI